jgi:tRNA pseudouridine55 synthase
MTAHDKRYEGTITLGVTTDTDDAEGIVIGTRPVRPVDAARLRAIERAFSGTIQQRPPAFSAISVGGTRAYASARRGVAVALPDRPVQVHSLQLSVLTATKLSIRVHCGPGTYIRALARDIGGHLGCGAHLSALRRTSAGSFSVAEAVTLDALTRAVEHGALEELLLPSDDGVRDMPAALITCERGALITRGEPLAPLRVPRCPVPLARIYEAAGAFLGVAEVTEAGMIRPIKVFASVP